MSRYGGANLAWQLGGDVALLRELAELHDALALVECRDRDNQPVDVAAILGLDWWVAQDVTNGALSGTAIAIRRRGPVKRRRVAAVLQRMVRISAGNHAVQARYLRAVPIRDEHGRATLMAAHIPLRSSGQQETAVDAVRAAWRRTRGRKLIFMDGNGRPAVVANRVTAPHHNGDGVMLWAWSRGWDSVRVAWRTFRGSDHKVGTLRA